MRGAALALGLLVLGGGCAPDPGSLTNLQTAEGRGIVVFGDSLANGYQVDPAQAYPARLERRLGVPVAAEGENGATSADGLASFDTRVPRHDPFLVVLEFGGNDFRHHVPRDQTFANMEALVRRVQRLGAVAVVVAMDVDVFGDSYGRGYRALARRHGAGVVTGLLDDVMMQPKYMVDPIHPNEAGHAFLADRVAAVLEPILARMPAAQRARRR